MIRNPYTTDLLDEAAAALREAQEAGMYTAPDKQCGDDPDNLLAIRVLVAARVHWEDRARELRSENAAR